MVRLETRLYDEARLARREDCPPDFGSPIEAIALSRTVFGWEVEDNENNDNKWYLHLIIPSVYLDLVDFKVEEIPDKISTDDCRRMFVTAYIFSQHRHLNEGALNHIAEDLVTANRGSIHDLVIATQNKSKQLRNVRNLDVSKPRRQSKPDFRSKWFTFLTKSTTINKGNFDLLHHYGCWQALSSVQRGIDRQSIQTISEKIRIRRFSRSGRTGLSPNIYGSIYALNIG